MTGQEASDGKAMSESGVSRNNDNRALARAVVLMEINDIVAIEGVRLARRLKAVAELHRAARRHKRTTHLQPEKGNDR